MRTSGTARFFKAYSRQCGNVSDVEEEASEAGGPGVFTASKPIGNVESSETSQLIMVLGVLVSGDEGSGAMTAH